MTKRYGCIGEKLKHSFSKEIHNAFADYAYDIIEIPRDELEAFAKKADFSAINVTIPYKELIMPYLYEIDDEALAIGAVNTVVNRGGRLYGYNTDFYGMSMLFTHAGISVKGQKVAILGTGGTSKTAEAVCASLGAKEIIKVSRSGRDGAVTYDALYTSHRDCNVIINTTPVGMFPSIYDCPVRLEEFESAVGVIDAIYNPLRTPLIIKARELGIRAEGGLYMLVAQAVRASEIFLEKEYPEGTVDSVYEKIFNSKENIVLTGMPASGKSTVGAIISELLGRKLIDTDELIVKKAGKPITEIFLDGGEPLFRKIECEVIKEVGAETSAIIATGGGAILRPENISSLKENGRIYFIDRPIDALVPTSDRPTANDVDSIKKRYSERYGIYTSSADRIINADRPAEEVAKLIVGDFKDENIRS